MTVLIKGGTVVNADRSLRADRNSFNNPSDVQLLEPNTEFFKYFTGSGK